MIQEDKNILLKDLCARLPYGVKVNYIFDDGSSCPFILSTKILNETIEKGFKPYLRPMSSMTEEEKSIMDSLWKENNKLVFADPDSIKRYRFYDISVVDFLNKHHFDYRGLIPMGLALEAPDGMYKTE